MITNAETVLKKKWKGRRYAAGTKRKFDIVCALILLLFTSPLFLLIVIMLAVTSSDPIIFRQKRLGYKGKPFTIFKFRTMRPGTAKRLDMVVKGDARVTRIGWVLRRSHLDELPQLWNVLIGDMSIVGPRPDELSIAYRLMKELPGYMDCFDRMKPGLTGPTRCRKKSVDARSRQGIVERNLQYHKEQSIIVDIKHLCLTVPDVLLGLGV